MRPRWLKIVLITPLAILGIVLFCFIGGELVMRLWNWLLPPLFGWRLINFWQALAMLALCRILFGRSGWHRAGVPNFRRRMRERWERMTPEEREKFSHGMRGRCGSFAGSPAPEPTRQP